MMSLAGGLAGAVAGAIAGSFLVTLILRWSSGRSVVHGRSSCDGCGRVLGALDLVPLFSLIHLRGRCRGCGAGIDPLHPAMELGCAVIGAIALAVMPDMGGALWALFGWLLLTLAVLDWRHFWLPDALTLLLALLGLTVGDRATGMGLADRALGAAIGYGSLLLISLAYRWLRRRDGLGLGDAKLLGAIGGWVGWQSLPFILLIASATGIALIVIRQAAGHGFNPHAKLPFGTMLAVAVWPGWWIAP